jgi:hypothetical protein
VKHREFITLLGGAAAAWPITGRAQQPERTRRIAILLNAAADDPRYQPWVGAFLQALALLGWTIGRNVRIDTRWATPNVAEIRRHAAELAALVGRTTRRVLSRTPAGAHPLVVSPAGEFSRPIAARRAARFPAFRRAVAHSAVRAMCS